MKQADLEKMFIEHKAQELAFEGLCYDCKEKSQVLATITDDGIAISGGAVYKPFTDETFYIKCESCYKKDNVLRDFQPCQVFTRCVGYYAAKDSMNVGKQAEVEMRKNFKLEHQEF